MNLTTPAKYFKYCISLSCHINASLHHLHIFTSYQSNSYIYLGTKLKSIEFLYVSGTLVHPQANVQSLKIVTFAFSVWLKWTISIFHHPLIKTHNIIISDTHSPDLRFPRWWVWRMSFSEMWRCVVLIRTNVSERCIASINRVASYCKHCL
jgi:hypothetical protein